MTVRRRGCALLCVGVSENLWGRSGEEDEAGSEGEKEKYEENQPTKLPLDPLNIVALFMQKHKQM